MTLIVLTYLFVCILRTFLYPVIYLFTFFYPWFSRRFNFEKLNLTDPACRPFYKDKLRGDIAFEISSEGELEQIRPIIAKALYDDLNIEIIYSSESVEKKCQILYETNKKQIRLFRLPLISFSLFPWPFSQNIFRFISSNKLVLCRYDFYPELMLLGSTGPVSFILLSATLKNKDLSKKKFRIFYKSLYNLFDRLICATKIDQDKLEDLGIRETKLSTYDFRIPQIINRLDKVEYILGEKLFFKSYARWLGVVDDNKRIIFGSIWPNEMDIFKNGDFKNEIKSGRIRCVLAPHKLGENFINELTSKIDKDLPFYVVNKNIDKNSVIELFNEIHIRPGLLIITVPGILCELYSTVQNAFVGGGHGRSIHSVLEPYVASCRVFCGPKTHRSTEFDMVKDFSSDQIHVINNLNEFYQHFKEVHENKIDFENRDKIFGEYLDRYVEETDKILIKDHFYV